MKRVCLLSENALSIQGVGRRQPAARILPQGHTAARIAQGHGAVGVVAAVLEADIEIFCICKDRKLLISSKEFTRFFELQVEFC